YQGQSHVRNFVVGCFGRFRQDAGRRREAATARTPRLASPVEGGAWKSQQLGWSASQGPAPNGHVPRTAGSSERSPAPSARQTDDQTDRRSVEHGYFPVRSGGARWRAPLYDQQRQPWRAEPIGANREGLLRPGAVLRDERRRKTLPPVF